MEEMLGAIPFLCNAPAHVRHLLSANVVWKNYIEGDFVVEEGAPAESMFIFVHGTAKVVRGPESKQVMEFKPGSFFGENSLWQEGQVRHASVIATSQCTCIEIPRAIYHQCDPAAAVKFQQQQTCPQEHHLADSTEAGSGRFVRQDGKMQEAGDFERVGSAGQMISASMHQAAQQPEGPPVPNYMRAHTRITASAARTVSAKTRLKPFVPAPPWLAEALSVISPRASRFAGHSSALRRAPLATGVSAADISDTLTRRSCNPPTIDQANQALPEQHPTATSRQHVEGIRASRSEEAEIERHSSHVLERAMSCPSDPAETASAPPRVLRRPLHDSPRLRNVQMHFPAPANDDQVHSHFPAPADGPTMWGWVNAALNQRDNLENGEVFDFATRQGTVGITDPSPPAYAAALPTLRTPRNTASERIAATRARHYFGNSGKDTVGGEMGFRRASSAGVEFRRVSSAGSTHRLPALRKSYAIEQINLRG